MESTPIILSDHFPDNPNEEKEILIKKAIANRDSFLIEYVYDINNVYLYDFNKDGKDDIIHSGYYEDYDGYITDIFIQNSTSFKPLYIRGCVTKIQFDTNGCLNKIHSYRADCCNYPFNDTYCYYFDSKKDTLIQQLNYKLAKPFWKEKFELPSSILAPKHAVLEDSTKLYPTSFGKLGAYSENQPFLKPGQIIIVHATKNDYVFISLKYTYFGKKNKTLALGWINKNKLKYGG